MVFLNIHTSLTAIVDYLNEIPNLLVRLITFGTILYDLMDEVTGGLYTDHPETFMYVGRSPLFLYPHIRQLGRSVNLFQPGPMRNMVFIIVTRVMEQLVGFA